MGKNVRVFPHCYIGDNSVIGSDTTIFSGVRIYEESIIGNHCTIHSNAVIGADGFGFAPQADNNYQKVAQIGNVVIEDHVEIGAGTTIDRATMGSTLIKKGVKLDNLIQIAHNVVIGENTVIAAQTGIAGSSKIGKNCMFGGQVGIIGHLEIGDEVKIAAQTGVSSNIKSGKIVMGSPAIDASRFRKSIVYFRNLESIVQRIEELEKEVKSRKG
jgi:UDP-3-O-[3-hydroxymyristoyl] glucosamine N-acyltransferase